MKYSFDGEHDNLEAAGTSDPIEGRVGCPHCSTVGHPRFLQYRASFKKPSVSPRSLLSIHRTTFGALVFCYLTFASPPLHHFLLPSPQTRLVKHLHLRTVFHHTPVILLLTVLHKTSIPASNPHYHVSIRLLLHELIR